MTSRFSDKEFARYQAFSSTWDNDLDGVFEDVADYYDKINFYASLGMWDRLRERFIGTVVCQPGQNALDVCAGTHAIGMALLEKQPALRVYGVDKSAAMLKQGRKQAQQKGLKINDAVCDAHRLPFPDNYFDIVTLQWATRHLRVIEAVSEIHRILKPGGYFYHCDLLRPANCFVEKSYRLYLKTCMAIIPRLLGSGAAPLKCRDYFVDAIGLFYSTNEFSELLREQGYTNVTSQSLIMGTVAFHKARKEK